MPSTCSLLVCEYLSILPELFVNLYYFGAGLEASLMRVWGKSKDVRTHTGLVIVQQTPGASFNIKAIMYSPSNSRPFGVQLPLVHTICGCTEGTGKWNFKTEIQNRIKVVFIYRSSCCNVELQVGIHPAQRRIVKIHDATFTEEGWDLATQSFRFTDSANVRMKIFVSVQYCILSRVSTNEPMYS
jgi:hypothetical protein